MATKQLANATEWTHTQLHRMKRGEVEDIARQLGIDKPNLIANKELIINAVMEAQGTLDLAPENLTPKEVIFCNLYASDREFFGNGVESYIEAFNINLSKPNAYLTAKSSASRLLKKPRVEKRINELLEESGLNDVNVDKQLGLLINQHVDLKTKLGAIKEYNDMKERVRRNTPDTINMNFFSFTDERAKELIDKHEQWMLENTKAIIDVSAD